MSNIADALVLIIDSDPDLRRSLSQMRCPNGYSIQSASSLDEAVASVRVSPPTAILCYLDLDPAHKQRATLQLRGAGVRCPIVMMSSTVAMSGGPIDGACLADFVDRVTLASMAA